MEWNSIEHQFEAMQTLILNTHALGPNGSAKVMAIPRHEIVFSENVSRAFERESLRELSKDPDDLPKHMMNALQS